MIFNSGHSLHFTLTVYGVPSRRGGCVICISGWDRTEKRWEDVCVLWTCVRVSSSFLREPCNSLSKNSGGSIEWWDFTFRRSEAKNFDHLIPTNCDWGMTCLWHSPLKRDLGRRVTIVDGSDGGDYIHGKVRTSLSSRSGGTNWFTSIVGWRLGHELPNW